jgi:hypothetical protein
MIQHLKFLKSWKILLLSLPFLSNCSIFSSEPLPPPEPKVIVETKFVKTNIPLQPRPKPLKMNNLEWYVVTEDNMDTFFQNLKKKQNEVVVFFAITPKGYENLSINVSDIKRYIIQQKEIIEYYEKSITDIPDI